MNWILDNLIASGAAKPMVVVMIDGHAKLEGPGLTGFALNTAWFARDLLEAAMPWVEAHYRVRTDAANRALVGLSMGGGEALAVGLNHPDVFAWVGAFSAATPEEPEVVAALADGEQLNGKLRLLWIAEGKDDLLRERNEAFLKLLDAHGVRHEWHLTEGRHQWPVWRGYLRELAPRLFQP